MWSVSIIKTHSYYIFHIALQIYAIGIRWLLLALHVQALPGRIWLQVVKALSFALGKSFAKPSLDFNCSLLLGVKQTFGDNIL